MKSEPEPQFDWADLDKMVRTRQKPPNAFTSSDFMARYGMKAGRAGELLREMVANGVLERQEGAGSLPAFYWYKKGKK